jgi:decaprenyl-phosphate phosphoribosyltransferase
VDQADPPLKRDIERTLLSLRGVRAVTITENPAPHVDAIYVEPIPGLNPQEIVQEVVAAARNHAGVDIVSDRIHLIPRLDVRLGVGAWLSAVLTAARPRQWVKNLLVFGAPATGGVLTQPDALASASLAFLAFCLASSGMYFINDVVDMEEDRQHPVKRRRPIASGVLSRSAAIMIGAAATVAAMFTAFAGGGLPLTGVVAAYVATVLTYTFVLRKIALLDLAAIAGGFLLRAIAGGVATGVPLSEWFLIVASFGSLYLAAGKRHAEFIQPASESGLQRASLGQYTEPYLRYIEFSSSTIAIAAYALWAFEGAAGGTIWSALSIIPFVLGIFRYGLQVEKGRAGAPEDAILRDGVLLFFGAAWVMFVALGVYLS